MTPEGKLTQAVYRRLRSLKQEGLPIWWTKLHGGPMQTRGLPDLLVVVGGQAVFFELKAEGGQPTRLQLARLNELRASGALAAVCTHAETVEKLIRLVVDLQITTHTQRTPPVAESAG